MVEMGFDNLVVEWSIWNLGLGVGIGGSDGELFWVKGEGKVGKIVERREGGGFVELWGKKLEGSCEEKDNPCGISIARSANDF